LRNGFKTNLNKKNAVFCKKRRFGRTSVLTNAIWRRTPEEGILKDGGDKKSSWINIYERPRRRWKYVTDIWELSVTANVVPSSLILVTLMIETILSSKMSVLTRATRRYISEDGILHSHRRENLKYYSYTSFTVRGHPSAHPSLS
jgi:hypothetical protein